MKITPTTAGDVPALQTVLDATDLFPAQMLPELLAAQDGAIWLTCHADAAAVGFCYAVPEQLTDGTWNMRALAVHPDAQGSGAGGALCRALEDRLRKDGQRLLIVDTSGTDGFAATRGFYVAQGFAEETRIREYWAAGDDKVTFAKHL